MGEINFFLEDINFTLRNKPQLRSWLGKIAKQEGAKISSLNYVFCSDAYLFDLNVRYLKHKTLTDIITFDNSDSLLKLDGDVFISIDRVADNASIHGNPFSLELRRVMVHGLLHLLGYKDKTKEQKALMRIKEDEYLKSFVPRGTTKASRSKRST